MPLTPPATALPASNVSTALARNRLGPFAIGSTIASSVAPLTVVTLVVSTALAVTGLRGVPVGIVTVAAILLIFAVGYLAMGRHIPNAGAFYAYVAHGIGRAFGVGTSWVALVSYNCFQLCLYGAFGTIAVPLVKQAFGVDLPWFVCAFVAWAIVAVLGANEVKMSEKILVVLVVTETLLVLCYSFAILLTPGFSFTGTAIAASNLWAPGAGTLIVIGMTAFAGVEQSAVYIEESKNPRRTIPIATYATIVTITGISVFAALVQISAGGPTVVPQATQQGSQLFFNQAAAQLGTAALHVGNILLLTSALAALIAFHNAVARYTFALGREGVLPRAFGRTTLAGAPRNASLTQTVLGLTVILLFAVAGWDPLTHLFYWGSTTGGLGVLLLITATSIAVIGFFARNPRGESVWHRLIAPSIATAILLVVSALAIDNLATLFGVEPGSGPARIVPTALLLIFAAGTAWGLILRRIKPDVYAGIGRGTRSTTGSALSAIA